MFLGSDNKTNIPEEKLKIINWTCPPHFSKSQNFQNPVCYNFFIIMATEEQDTESRPGTPSAHTPMSRNHGHDETPETDRNNTVLEIIYFIGRPFCAVQKISTRNVNILICSLTKGGCLCMKDNN